MLVPTMLGDLGVKAQGEINLNFCLKGLWDSKGNEK